MVITKTVSKPNNTGLEPNKTPTTKNSVKPFTDACFTCKKRRVHCDMTRPFCNTCKLKNKLVCEGYDVKLRWSDPIEFDVYGDVSANPKNSKILDSDNKDPQYQRRKIKFLHYKKEYEYYEEMDDELSLLNRALVQYRDKIKEGNTWMIEKFGVFEGIKYEKIMKKKGSKKKHTKKLKSKGKKIVARKSRIPRKYTKKKAKSELESLNSASKDQDFFTTIFENINVNPKRNEFISPMTGIIPQPDMGSADFGMNHVKNDIGTMTNDYSEKYDRKHHENQDKTELSLNAYFEEIFKHNNNDVNNTFLNKNDDYGSMVDSANIDINKIFNNDPYGKRLSRSDEGTMISNIHPDHSLLASEVKDLEKKKADLMQEISELLLIKSNLAKEVFE